MYSALLSSRPVSARITPQWVITATWLRSARRSALARNAAQRSAEADLALRRHAPPKFLEVGKIEIRPERRQLPRRRALVAGEHAALPDQRLHRDRQAERIADDGRGLQGPPVGARHQPTDAGLGQPIGQLRRLTSAGCGQRRIGNPRVDSGAREEPVPLRLGVTHQDHGRRPQSPRGGGMSAWAWFQSSICSYSASMIGPGAPGAWSRGGLDTPITCASM